MIAWDPIFVGQYDSQWGLLQTWSWLTGVSPPVLLREMLGVRQLKQVNGPHLYDFVNTGWLTRCDESVAARAKCANLGAASNAMLAILNKHSGESMLGGLAGVILEVEHLRFCCRCLRIGYHSIVHQIAGLVRCPIHNDPLQTRCPNCATETPPFAMSPSPSEYRCPHCHESWLNAGMVHPRPNFWRAQEDEKIGAIIRWVVQVQAGTPSWLRRSRCMDGHWFRTSRRNDGIGVSYKAALVWAMHEIIPFPLNPALLTHRPLGLHLSPDQTMARCMRLGSNDKAAGMTNDYILAIVRRHFTLNVLKQHRRCIHDAQWVLTNAEVEGFWLRFDSLLCPVGFAFIWWGLKSARWLKRLDPPSRQLSNDQVLCTWSTLLNSFYASVQAAILMRRWVASRRPEAQGVLVRGVDAWTDPWLDGTMELSETPQVAQGQSHRQFLLFDAAALATSRCDRGRALRVRLSHGDTIRSQTSHAIDLPEPHRAKCL